MTDGDGVQRKRDQNLFLSDHLNPAYDPPFDKLRTELQWAFLM